jgi:hypothetical protein
MVRSGRGPKHGPLPVSTRWNQRADRCRAKEGRAVAAGLKIQQLQAARGLWVLDYGKPAARRLLPNRARVPNLQRPSGKSLNAMQSPLSHQGAAEPFQNRLAGGQAQVSCLPGALRYAGHAGSEQSPGCILTAMRLQEPHISTCSDEESTGWQERSSACTPR